MYTEKRNESGVLIGIVRDSDNAHIPLADGNRDYADYQEWIAAGNAPAPDPAWEDLLAQKRLKRDRINAEAERRILAKWPMTIQASVNAGLYTALAAMMQTEIATIVGESNAARDVVFSMTDIALVRAYDPVTGPSWTDIGTYTQTEPI